MLKTNLAMHTERHFPKTTLLSWLKSTYFISLVMALTYPISSEARDIPAYVMSQHTASLQAFLRSHPHLRLPNDALCQCEKQLAQHRSDEPAFQPYYAVGDINDDAIEDFAVGLIDTRVLQDTAPKITVVIFHGPFKRSKTSRGIAVIKNYPITKSQEILSVFKARWEEGNGRSYRYPARLDLGPSPFGSDNNWFIVYDWKARKYVVH